MKELIFHILHRQFPFFEHSDVTYNYRVKCAPSLEHACVLDTSNEKIYHFTSNNADELSTLISEAQNIISYRGKEFGLLVLQKHHKLPRKLKKGNVHNDLHDSFIKLNKGNNVSLNKAVYSNIGKKAYKERQAFRYMNTDQLKICCESDILNIFKLYKLFANNKLVLKKMLKKASKKLKLHPQEISSPIDISKPSEVRDTYWLNTERKKKGYPIHTTNGGKWLVFAPLSKIDDVWVKIMLATEEGKLGGFTKVATAKPNPNARDPNTKVICVYTYDWTDKDDVMRIREELRLLGVLSKISYKADQETHSGKYTNRGNTRISKYYE